jgi:hypothetical protein
VFTDDIMPDTLPHSIPEKSVAAMISTPVSDNQGQSLEAFKAKLRNVGLYQPASDDIAASHDDIAASHDDISLLYVPVFEHDVSSSSIQAYVVSGVSYELGSMM